jgi:hypothetical protein
LPHGLGGYNAEVREHDGARRGDGWQVYDLADHVLDGPRGLLLELAAESASPVVGAYIADSDYGQVVGVDPSGEAWGAWLSPNTAFAFEREELTAKGMPRAEATRQARDVMARFGMSPAQAARHAVAWAAQAGYNVPARPIRQILRTGRPPGLSAQLRLPWKRYVFAEDGFFDLLDSLGLPKAGI